MISAVGRSPVVAKTARDAIARIYVNGSLGLVEALKEAAGGFRLHGLFASAEEERRYVAYHLTRTACLAVTGTVTLTAWDIRGRTAAERIDLLGKVADAAEPPRRFAVIDGGEL